MNFLVLVIGCAECTEGRETLVSVLGYADDLQSAKWMTGDNKVVWVECSNGWYSADGRMGEYRIIDLTSIEA
jgi:hypothetical protein